MAFMSRMKDRMGFGVEREFQDLQRIPSREDLLSLDEDVSSKDRGISLFSKDASLHSSGKGRSPKEVPKSKSFRDNSSSSTFQSDKENVSNQNANPISRVVSTGNMRFYEARGNTMRPVPSVKGADAVKDSRFASNRSINTVPSTDSWYNQAFPSSNNILDIDDDISNQQTLYETHSMSRDDAHLTWKPTEAKSDENPFEVSQELEEEDEVAEEVYPYDNEEPITVYDPPSSSTKSRYEDEIIEFVFSKARHDRQDTVLEMLMQDQFHPNSRDVHGNTLLHVCAQNNNRSLANKIVKLCGDTVDVSAKNHKGLTALDYCDKYGHVKFRIWLTGVGGRSGTTDKAEQFYSRR